MAVSFSSSKLLTLMDLWRLDLICFKYPYVYHQKQIIVIIQNDKKLLKSVFYFDYNLS
jgi:hypothetical protein